jgi:putative endopeptidase
MAFHRLRATVAMAGTPAILAAALLALGNGGAVEMASASASSDAPMGSGIDLQFIDGNVRAQDDFYKHVNGKWLATREIPADKGSFGMFDRVRDEVQDQLRGLVDGLEQHADGSDPDQQKIADLYASFMEEAALEPLGFKPLLSEFAQIDAVSDKEDIAALIARFNRLGIVAPYAASVHQDAKESTRYTFDLRQGGLGMPDRDYYLKDDDKLKTIRGQYRQHVEKMLALAGDLAPASNAEAILALETALAKVQWTKVENRDPVKTYNKVELAKLGALASGYSWKAYLRDAGVEGRIDYLNVSQPSYIQGLGQILQQTSLPVWKTYFRWHLLSELAPYLSKDFVDENFAFYGKALRDIPQDKPRWKRGIELVDDAIGEGLGSCTWPGTSRHSPRRAWTSS